MSIDLSIYKSFVLNCQSIVGDRLSLIKAFYTNLLIATQGLCAEKQYGKQPGFTSGMCFELTKHHLRGALNLECRFWTRPS